MKKRHVFYIFVLISLAIGTALTLALFFAGMFNNYTENPDIVNAIAFGVVSVITAFLALSVLFSHRFASGVVQEILFVFASILVVAEILGYLVFSLIDCGFTFNEIDWLGAFTRSAVSWQYYVSVGVLFLAIFLLYILIINKDFLDIFTRKSGNGVKPVKGSNLENSRWMTSKEKKSLFSYYSYSELGNVEKDGIPVGASLIGKDKDMEVGFNAPCHSIIIGSTGSGKTTTFVSPMIQLLGATKAGSSMVITDPKGELFMLHSKYLRDRGYDVKVIDLRDAYSSYRWNPLDVIWDNFELYRNAHTLAYKRTDSIERSGLKIVDGDHHDLASLPEWYEFEGKAYVDYQRLINAVKIYKKKVFDEVYEDLNDLVTVLIPVENEKDPLWEKGARSITLAVLLAMLEDSTDPKNNMTKEKFNFFNLAKILQNSNGDYQALRDYFKGRSALSRAYSLSKQVCDAAPSTRASYMSIVYDKLMLFNDIGVCSLTSASDFTASALAEHPTALFLKIPDEKDTRHNLAAIFILNIYKTLIKVASASEGLTLPRNVYFIMDEFGNMPKISKFDKFITVGRSRKIWFTMIVQSYAQLNNVYGDNVADIIKGNCGIKMFIGSNDMETCKEYSELCGNITIATTSTSGTAHSETNYSTSYQTRPLIYPSELQRLNHPGDIGHGIIVTFGNYPLKTYFTPSFKVPLYHFGEMDSSELEERSFNEKEVFYDIRQRNNRVLEAKAERGHAKGEEATEHKKPLDDFTPEQILEQFLEYQKVNPHLTLKEFIALVNKGEIQIKKETGK